MDIMADRQRQSEVWMSLERKKMEMAGLGKVPVDQLTGDT